MQLQTSPDFKKLKPRLLKLWRLKFVVFYCIKPKNLWFQNHASDYVVLFLHWVKDFFLEATTQPLPWDLSVLSGHTKAQVDAISWKWILCRRLGEKFIQCFAWWTWQRELHVLLHGVHCLIRYTALLGHLSVHYPLYLRTFQNMGLWPIILLSGGYTAVANLGNYLFATLASFQKYTVLLRWTWMFWLKKWLLKFWHLTYICSHILQRMPAL